MVYYVEKEDKKEREVYISVGPQHSGIGHFRMTIKLDGDIIVDAIPDPGFVHRSAEKIAENFRYLHVIPLVEKVTHVDATNTALAYVRTVEEIAGVEVPERAKYLRTIMAEISRIASHLYYFAIQAIFMNHSTIFMWATGDRDLFLDLAQTLTGGRIAHSYPIYGGVRNDAPTDFFKKAMKVLDYFERRLKEYEKVFIKNPVIMERMQGVGVLRREDAIRLGAVGPVLRGSGVRMDVRKVEPYEAYDKIDFFVPSFKEGDSYSRMLVRFIELQQSVNIIRQAIKNIPDGPVRPKRLMVAWKVPPGEAYSRVESARGELGYYLISTGGASPYRLRMAVPSFKHLNVLRHLLKGATLADMPVIYWSLDYWPPEADK